MNMAVIDIVLGVLLLFGLVRGLMKGLFVEIASLLALILGIYGAIHFSNYAAEILSSKFEWDEQYINITAFAITFVVIVLAISLAGKALTKLADFAALGWINKLLGAVFGLIKMGLICSVILIVLDRMSIDIAPTETDDEKSILYQPVYNLAPMLFPKVLPELEELIPTDQEA
jgi:membrane protein required for colicin V production